MSPRNTNPNPRRSNRMSIIRQGDVSLVPAEAPKGNANPVKNPVLALGEVTGTKHVLVAECREYVDDFDRRFIQVLTDGGVIEQTGPGSHHAPITVQPGWYRASIAREQDFYAGVSRQTSD
jgi:hypothetical protein